MAGRVHRVGGGWVAGEKLPGEDIAEGDTLDAHGVPKRGAGRGGGRRRARACHPAAAEKAPGRGAQQAKMEGGGGARRGGREGAGTRGAWSARIWGRR